MRRTILVILAFYFSTDVHSQGDSTQAKLAKVNVFVTDMKGKPSKGEQILFRSEATKSIASGISDATGKFSLELPAGDKYIITVKRIIDSTRYGSLSIPSLPEDEFYTEPFKVTVKFEVSRTYTLDNVHFDFGKATLRADSFAELEELVGYLKHKEDIKVEIAGHTDDVGSAADNLKLSQQRADAIRAYLIKKGIKPGRVTAKGYGATNPVADNDTDEGRQLNRRTEVRIL
ncbi:MAG: OmpA family protein [Chitinophagales bacterium]